MVNLLDVYISIIIKLFIKIVSLDIAKKVYDDYFYSSFHLFIVFPVMYMIFVIFCEDVL